MTEVENTGLFTCLRGKQWRGLSEREIESLAGKFMEVVRRERDGQPDYLSAVRFLEDVSQRLVFGLSCWRLEDDGCRERAVFFRLSTVPSSLSGWSCAWRMSWPAIRIVPFPGVLTPAVPAWWSGAVVTV